MSDEHHTADITDILQKAVQAGASDIHITVGLPPVFRIDGTLFPQGSRPLSPEETAALFAGISTPAQQERMEAKGEVDFSYSIHGTGRFRVNAFRQRGTVGLALRVIPSRVPALKELGAPEVMYELARRLAGLLLVTGPTGSGKSTTLAAVIDLINEERSCHIVTLEDPIEYLHRHRRSIVNQREIGIDSLSFASALRAVLRQDPDVILVGEMRDLETIGTALTAAETGHLVLASLHTPDACQAIDRIVDVFPPHQQGQVRIQLAGTLVAVVAQQLLPRADGRGRVAAFEVLVGTSAVRNLIREGKTHQLVSAIEVGDRFGMKTMKASLDGLVQRGLIDSREYQLRVSGLSS